MDRSNIIVNYLPSSISEADLENMFKPFGSIVSVKVCFNQRGLKFVQIVRDKHTGISMGFGFVNFENNISATEAVSCLNGIKLREDKIMKVSIARPAWKANIHSNLYIAGLPLSYTEADIMTFLGSHSFNAENIRLLRDSNKKPRGAAVIRMSCEEAATSAIAALNGAPIKTEAGSTVVQVRPWRPEFRVDRISDENIANSFVWSRQRSKRPGNSNSKNSGTNFANYPDAQQLLQTISTQHRQGLMSRPLPPPTVTFTPETYNTESEEERLATLFVFHLPSAMTEAGLTGLFGQFGGHIESVQVMPNKGYGFISFYNELEAVTAMENLDGISLDGGHKPIRIELKY
jgi:RNA recognition motif-containing protein